MQLKPFNYYEQYQQRQGMMDRIGQDVQKTAAAGAQLAARMKEGGYINEVIEKLTKMYPGVPFTVPENVTAEQMTKWTQDYVMSQGMLESAKKERPRMQGVSPEWRFTTPDQMQKSVEMLTKAYDTAEKGKEVAGAMAAKTSGEIEQGMAERPFSSGLAATELQNRHGELQGQEQGAEAVGQVQKALQEKGTGSYRPEILAATPASAAANKAGMEAIKQVPQKSQYNPLSFGQSVQNSAMAQLNGEESRYKSLSSSKDITDGMRMEALAKMKLANELKPLANTFDAAGAMEKMKDVWAQDGLKRTKDEIIRKIVVDYPAQSFQKQKDPAAKYKLALGRGILDYEDENGKPYFTDADDFIRQAAVILPVKEKKWWDSWQLFGGGQAAPAVVGGGKYSPQKIALAQQAMSDPNATPEEKAQAQKILAGQ